MNKQIIIFTFIFLVLFSFAYAAQPQNVQLSESVPALSVILYPKDDYFLYNSTFNFHVHMINRSGYPVNNTNFDCSAHFYSTQNNHLLDLASLPDATHDWDEYFVINRTLTTENGTHPYNVWCWEMDDQANLISYAYVSAAFYITDDSEEKQLNGSGLLAIIILIPIILAIFMIIGSATLGQDHNVLKIFLYLLSVPMLWISLHFGMIGLVKYYGLVELQESIGTFTYWTAWLFFVFVTYFIFYWIYKITNYMANKKDKELKY